jgi:aldehyde dehydrogenase (NAD+)
MTALIENLVDGTWSQDGDGSPQPNLNPADQRDVVGVYPMATEAQAADVVDAAVKAFPGWRRTSAIDRGVLLSRAADLLRERSESIAADITRENGKTLAEARVEVIKSADFLDYYAGIARLPFGDLLDDARPNAFVFTRREPIGVIVAITPWNDPLLTPARKISPALVTGNTVVVKPSPETPLSMQHLARALHDAGLPAGVLNTVNAANEVVGSAVLADDRIAAVTFTGSTRTGFALQRALAGRTVRFQAEMGGKNASVVMPDADLDLAVRTIAAAAFAQAGQRCTATSRVIAHSDVHDLLVERLVSAAATYRPGDGARGAVMGPVVHRDHQASVLRFVREAQSQGATVLTGGDAPTDDDRKHGCFVNPTVLGDVTPEMTIWRQEVFGPVIAVARAADLDHAVALVNESDYGLSAAIFTADLHAAHRFIDDVDTGQVSVNLPTSGWDVHQPFGGFKQSGSSFKEQGLDALRYYTKTKTAAIAHGVLP